jgi:lysophospholipase L1-like esterase
MTRILLTLGDSWPEGAELGAGRRYGEILKDTMGFDQLLNYGSGGASNEDMLYQLQDYLQCHTADCEVTAVFFLTNPARTAHFPRFLSWHQADAHSKEIYTHFHTKQHEIMRSSATVSALQHWCDAFDIDDYYFAGWVRYTHWLPGVDLDRIWAKGQETAADWFGASDHNGEHLINVQTNTYIRPNFAHPNQLGHDLIAEKLQSWIQSKQ